MGLSLKSDYTIDVSYLSDIYFIYLIFLARLISTSRVDDICQSKFYMGVEFTLAIEVPKILWSIAKVTSSLPK